MSYSVKAHNLGGIQSYGESITSFSVALTAAAAQTQRSFTDRVGGQRGEVINAFFGKLNILQDQVFQQAPEVLKTYGEGVSDFGHTVQGLGFGNFAYTDKGAIDGIVNTLKGPQYEEMIAKKNGLKSLMEEAQEALGFGTVDFTGYDERAQAFINDEVNARNTTHQGISDSDDALKKVAETGKAAFEDLADTIQNAQAVIGVSPKVVYHAIMKENPITVEQVDYLDIIKNEADAEIMVAAWNDNLESTHAIASSSISENGYLIISTEIAMAMEQGNINKIQRYFNGFGKISPEETKAHIENLKTVNDKYAGKLQAIQAGLKEAKYDESNPDMIAMKKRLRTLNKFNGLLQSVEDLGLGSSSSEINNGMQGVYKKNISYDFEIVKLDDSDNITFKVTKNNSLGVPETKIYTSGLSTTYSDKALEASYKELTDIKKQQASEQVEFWKSMGEWALDLVPGGKPTKIAIGTFKVMLNSLDSFDKATAIGTASEGLPDEITINGKKIPLETFKSGFNKFVESQQTYNENLSELEEKEMAARNDIVRGFTNKGAWKMEENNVPDFDLWKGYTPAHNTNTMKVDATHYYDYDAYMREQYLDDKGVSQYLTSEQMNAYVGDIKYKVDQEIIDYVKGKSDSQISKMDSKQLEQLKVALDNIPGEREEFSKNFLWNNKYQEVAQ